MKVTCMYFDNKNNFMVYLKSDKRTMVQRYKINKVKNVPKLFQEFKDIVELREFIGGKENG